jgi:hypothetical protein
MFDSNVQPKRRIRVRPTAWQCSCPGAAPDAYKVNGAQLTRCPVCGLARHHEPAVTDVARSR